MGLFFYWLRSALWVDRSLGFGSRLLMRLGLRMWRILGSSRRCRTRLALWTRSCLLGSSLCVRCILRLWCARLGRLRTRLAFGLCRARSRMRCVLRARRCFLRRSLCMRCILRFWRGRLGGLWTRLAFRLCRARSCLVRGRFVLGSLTFGCLVRSRFVLGSFTFSYLVLGGLVRCASLLGCYRTLARKFSRFGCCSDWRLPLVHRSSLFRVGAGSSHLLRLSSYRGDMFLVGRGLILSRRASSDPTCATVIADAVHCRIVDHFGVVSVVNIGNIHVVDRSVVLELSVVPAATLITFTAVTETIIDPAVETDLRTPVALIESKSAPAPAPIAWSPEKAGLRSHNPGTWHKEVTAVAVSPVARCPKITLGGDGRLLVHRQRGRAN